MFEYKNADSALGTEVDVCDKSGRRIQVVNKRKFALLDTIPNEIAYQFVSFWYDIRGS